MVRTEVERQGFNLRPILHRLRGFGREGRAVALLTRRTTDRLDLVFGGLQAQRGQVDDLPALPLRGGHGAQVSTAAATVAGAMAYGDIRVAAEAEGATGMTGLAARTFARALPQGARLLVEAIAGRRLMGIMAIPRQPLFQFSDALAEELDLGQQLLHQGDRRSGPSSVDSFDLFSCLW